MTALPVAAVRSSEGPGVVARGRDIGRTVPRTPVLPHTRPHRLRRRDAVGPYPPAMSSSSSSPLAVLSELPLTKDQARTALVSLRLGLAAATWLAPRTTLRVFGIDPVLNPAAPFLLRLFGTRDAWLAVEVLAADDPDPILRSHVAVDVADAGAALMASGGRQMPRRAAFAAALVAGTAAVLGYLASED